MMRTEGKYLTDDAIQKIYHANGWVEVVMEDQQEDGEEEPEEDDENDTPRDPPGGGPPDRDPPGELLATQVLVGMVRRMRTGVRTAHRVERWNQKVNRRQRPGNVLCGMPKLVRWSKL